MAETGVDGVMIAEGSLHNPALFAGETPIIWEIALEYLDFAEKFPPCPPSYARGHIFKICHHGLQKHVAARTMLSDARSLKDMEKAVIALRDACKLTCWSKGETDAALPFPHWLCQPYVRPPPSKPRQSHSCPKVYSDSVATTISKKKMKKLLKRGCDLSDLANLETSEKAAKIANLLYKPPKPEYLKCVQCGNPGGTRCIFIRCKPCCKLRMKESKIQCSYHSNVKRSFEEPNENYTSLSNIANTSN